MKRFIIPAVVIVTALALWQKDAIRETWETRDMTESEKEEWKLEEQGVIDAQGKVDVDDEFDKDLNDMDKEMRDADENGSDDLDELETEE